jgi:hypothetical protein
MAGGFARVDGANVPFLLSINGSVFVLLAILGESSGAYPGRTLWLADIKLAIPLPPEFAPELAASAPNVDFL